MLKDKVVLITGASSGLGAELAIRIAKEGGIPILTARSLDKLNKVAEKIDGRYEVYKVDVSSADEINNCVKDIINKYKKIDILINNAGFGVFDYFIEADIDTYERMMDINYMGMVRATKIVLPYMIKVDSGHIINIASVAGKLATAKAAGYSATKFAMVGFSNSLRYELTNTNISVSTINPGPIATPFFDVADPSGQYVKNVKWMMLSTEKVVDKIIVAINKKKKDITIPFIAKIGVKLYYLFPNMFDRFIASSLNKK